MELMLIVTQDESTADDPYDVNVTKERTKKTGR